MKNISNQLLKIRNSSSSIETRKMVIYVLVCGLAGTLILAITDINRSHMIALGTVFLVSIFLASKEYMSLARWGALITAFALISSLMIINNGIRDTAVIGLVVVLISAGLLAGRRGTLILGSLILLVIIALGILESQGVIANKFSQYNYLADYMVVGISFALITILQWLVINRLNLNIKKASDELLEREQIEKRLRDAENRYRSLVERIPAVVYIAEPGQNGRWEYINPHIKQITGFSPEEWLNDPNLWRNLLHPDDREKTIELEDGAIRKGHMPQLEYRLKTRAGNYIWIYDESLLSIDADNKGMVQGFMLDITARKAAEEQLQQRLGELQAVYGVSDTLINKTDLQKLIRDTGEQIRGAFNAHNVLIAIHDPVSDLINFPYDYEDNELRPNTSIRYGKGMTTKIMQTRKPLILNENWLEETAKLNAIYTNRIFPKSSISVPIMTPSTVIGIITLENIEHEHVFTENDIRLLSTISGNLAVAIENTRLHESIKQELAIQEKLISQLESKNAELERFTYTASHDLKSPLITIRGFLGYLEQDARNGNLERLHRDINRISEATEKMHRLLNELLELSRVGRVMNEPQNIPFEEVVKEALSKVEGQLKARQVQVKVGSDLPQVFGDKERLVEVVQNLMDNASKFMGTQKEPTIEVGMEMRENKIIFFVKDNGIGIKQEFHDKVFGLFDKLDTNSEGTGIGLALVKRIIEVHGGRIWVESEGTEMGTKFCFTLSIENLSQKNK